MPNSKNNLRGEQWDECQRCGFRFPISQLTIQKGLKVCYRSCVDRLEVERRPFFIEQTLTPQVNEGADLRNVDLAWNRGEEVLEQ